MKRITVEQMQVWHPCEDYTEARLRELMPRGSLDALEIARLDAMPVADRLWALLRPEVLGSQFKPVLGQIADRAVRNHALHCGVSAVERWARRWLSGEDRSEAAAWAAARAAAEAAAWAAAWAAARAAAEAAAWATDAAARAAAWAARAEAAAARAAEAAARAAEAAARAAEAADAAWEAEHAWQLGVVVEALEVLQ